MVTGFHAKLETGARWGISMRGISAEREEFSGGWPASSIDMRPRVLLDLANAKIDFRPISDEKATLVIWQSPSSPCWTIPRLSNFTPEVSDHEYKRFPSPTAKVLAYAEYARIEQ